jgi:hypothetical protein
MKRTLPLDCIDELPDWLVPEPAGAEAQTGWISPEGVLYGCPPWAHAALAGELLSIYRRTHTTDDWVESYDLLYALGWVQVTKPDKRDRRPTGGFFHVYNEPNEVQAGMLLRWIEAGARFESFDTKGNPES